MSVASVRGGVPHVFRAAIDDTGRKHVLPNWSMFLAVRVASGVACRLYFSEADYTDNVNYVVVPAASAATPNGEWSGPAEIGDIWLRTDTTGTSNVELVSYQRRG